MVKFYIVDDEDMIRDGLQFYLNWDEFGAQVVGSQINGERAMPEILQLNPDVVITDVVMPRMDGIELASKLRLSGYGGEIIFLSAYQEMSYVKTAFKFDAVDFIFKPIQTDEMITVIKNIVEVVNKKKKKNALVLAAEKAMQDLKKLEMEKLWMDLLYKGKKINSQILRLYGDRFTDIVEDYRGFCVLLVHSYSFPTDLINKQLQSWKTELSRNIVFAFSTIEDTNTICEVVAFKKVDSNNIENEANKMYQQLQQHFHLYGNNVIVKLGRTVDDVKNIGISLKDAHQSLAVHFAHGLEASLPVNTMESDIFGQEFKEKWGKKLEEAILSRDDSKIETTIVIFLKLMLDYGIHELNIIKANCMLLCFMVCENLYLTKSDNVFNEFIANASCILDCICIDDISLCFKNAVIGLKQALPEQSSKIKLAKKIKAIIKEDLDTVDINSISKKINISKNHLSLEFKRYTGKTINDYITYERMEKAKQLLMEGGLYIYEVANQVGYKDVAYFSKLFKQTVGCLPAEFKERLDIL